MSQILVRDFNRELAEDIIALLRDYKLVNGPLALNGTLQKHPKLKKFLHEHFSCDIMQLERNIG